VYWRANRATQITVARMNQYIDHRLEEGAARATVQQELAALRRMFTLTPEIANAPRVPRLSVDNARKVFFEPDELAAVLRHLPNYLRDPVEFAAITGWRFRSEVLPLTWEQVDLDAGEVRLLTSKNKAGRVFPFQFHPGLQEMFERRWTQRTLCPLVFPSRSGDRITDYRKAWQSACKKAGFPGVTYAPGGKVLHDLRRTAVRNLVRAGVPETVAMKLTGHKTRAIFDRYDITSGKDLQDAATKLAAYHAQQDAELKIHDWRHARGA